ncbi:MAG: hypothetical protein ACIAXF_02075 [Phycisphaerales bacterium JB063]
MTKMIKSALTRIIREEKGAEALEKILIVAAIALPLLGLLLFFSGAIRDWVTGNWETVQGNQDINDASDNPF